jgi:hypothetical protein
VLTNLPDDEYRLAHRASNSYWIAESALLRIASTFTN